MEVRYFELMEWHDRRYQHVKYVKGTPDDAKTAQVKMNEGYTGPRFVLREVACPTTR